MSENREYKELRDLVEELGGSMNFLPGGGPGGVWEIMLRGKIARIECRSHFVNDLDSVYVANTEKPGTWADFDEPYELLDDAFWRLVDVVRKNEVASSGS